MPSRPVMLLKITFESSINSQMFQSRIVDESSDEQFPFKCFLNIAFVKETSQKMSGGFGIKGLIIRRSMSYQTNILSSKQK